MRYFSAKTAKSPETLAVQRFRRKFTFAETLQKGGAHAQNPLAQARIESFAETASVMICILILLHDHHGGYFMTKYNIVLHNDWHELATDTVPGFPLQYLPADCATLVRK